MFKNKLLKRLTITAVIIAVLLIAINQKDMTLRQSLVKIFYPVIMFAGKISGSKNSILQNSSNTKPLTDFYSLKAIDNTGNEINFQQFKGKKILIVNTASDCGFTAQYEELQKLYTQYRNSLIIIGFPANDFKEQEQGNDETIAAFCKANFGVTFLLMKKSTVIKSAAQNEVFQWLTDKNKNGWNSQEPQWNFSKYLVNEHGILMNYFPSAVSPLSDEVIAAIK